MGRCGAGLRSCRAYAVVILLPYLVLLVLFHRQLQTPHSGTDVDREDAELVTTPQQDARQLAAQQDVGRSDDKLVPDHHMAVQRRPVASHNLATYNLSPSHQQSVQLAERKDPVVDKGIAAANFRDLPKIDQLYQQQAAKGFQLPNISGLAAEGDLPHLLVSDPQASVANPIADHCRKLLPDTHVLQRTQFQPLLGNYLYSAYLDDRTDSWFIRIIALLKRSDKPPLFCHFAATNTSWEEATGQMHSSPVTEYYEMCENHAKDFGGWILSCEVPSEVVSIPCHVVVSAHSDYRERLRPSVTLPVLTVSTPWEQKENFGICVPPLFGYIPSMTIVEFIELNRLLGASHIVFYQHQIPREMSKVLQYYQGMGFITVLDWNLPVQDKAIWYHGQLVAINDCLYRGMYRFKYMAFHDIDEFVVPHKHYNWSLMLESLQHQALAKDHQHCAYTFQSAFFDPLMGSTVRALYDLESDLRTKSFSVVRTKVMVNPEHIFELGIHHVSKPVSNSCKLVYVEPELAFIHHYRKCVTDFDPKMNCQVFARDESLSRYIPTLRHDVHRTLWILKEIDRVARRQQQDYDGGHQ